MKDIKLSSKKEEVTEQQVDSFGTSPDESTLGNVDKEIISQNKKNKYRRIRKIVASFMGLALLFFVTTLYSQYQIFVLKNKATSTSFSQLQTNELRDPLKVIEAVSRHMILPTTTPQVAAVEDSVRLSSSQPFFKDVLNGDVVLMYKAMIIVYRPSKDIIVTVGDIRGE